MNYEEAKKKQEELLTNQNYRLAEVSCCCVCVYGLDYYGEYECMNPMYALGGMPSIHPGAICNLFELCSEKDFVNKGFDDYSYPLHRSTK